MHDWQEKLSTSCRVYRLDFCLMATALGAIREECAGKHLNASAHLAKNFDRGAKSKTLSPARETGTQGECRAMRASHGFLKTSFLPHITLSSFDSPVLYGSDQIDERWDWKADETGLTLVWEGAGEQQNQKVAYFHLSVNSGLFTPGLCFTAAELFSSFMLGKLWMYWIPFLIWYDF